MIDKIADLRRGKHRTRPVTKEADRPASRRPQSEADRPEPEWVRGLCPECGDALVSNMYYVGGKGYLIVWECWESLSESPKCDYRRVL